MARKLVGTPHRPARRQGRQRHRLLLARRQNLGLAIHYQFIALVKHPRGDPHTKLRQFLEDFQAHGQGVANLHRLLKAHLLTDINSPRPRQLASHGRADQRTAEHAVSDALLEHGAGGEFRVQVHRVVITRHRGEQLNVALFDRLAVAGGLADFEGFVWGVGNLGHLFQFL